ARAHQEGLNDLSPREDERLPEQALPFLRRARMVRVEPPGEGAVRLADREHATRVLGHGADLQAVADDARVLQQALVLALAEPRDLLRLEARVGLSEPLALLEHRQPGQPRLVDLQREALE